MIDVYAWLLTHLDGYERFQNTPLIPPNEDFFPVEEGRASDRLALALFRQALNHAGMPEDWNIRLRPIREEPTTVHLMGEDVAFGASAPRRGAVSSVSIRPDGITVHYAPHLLERPELFVAALGYEFARLLVMGPAAEYELPGVDTIEGPFLEVAATFLGFGVFAANSVYNMEMVQGVRTQGCNIHSLGVLSEVEVSYALALFLALKGRGAREAKQHLKDNPRSYVQSALKVIERDGAQSLAALRAIADASTS